MEERISYLIKALARSLSRASASRLIRGLEKAVKTGDPAFIYHELSKLEPGYYGDDLPYTADGYYKSYEGSECRRLPGPRRDPGLGVFEAIRSRRSRREYSGEPLTLQEASDILYYSVGVTGRAWWGGPKRSYPSAGALQPVEAYPVVRLVEGLEPGVYHYNPGRHCLEILRRGDYSRRLASIALGQDHVAEASMVVVLTAVYHRTGSKYGHRSYRYMHWDVGFAGENIYLVVESLGLATVAVGAFYDDLVCDLLGVDCDVEVPMLLFPIGRRASWQKL